MKKLLFLPILFFFACKSIKNATKVLDSNTYRYSINLNQVKKDTLNVRLEVPLIKQNMLTFVVPKIVPGIYGAMNFGQYVSSFQAIDDKGQVLSTTKLDENTWQIKQAEHLKYITYKVADTWDDFNFIQDFYRSAGSSYVENEFFILNYNTFVGYFEGFEKMPYEVNFTKPNGFYGASYLTPTRINDTLERVNTLNYNDLVDAPILYAKPDTAWLKIGKTDILVAVHTKNKEKYATKLAEKIKPMLESQRLYLGGTLPVEKYAFLVYFEPTKNDGDFMGDGLEHSQSTLCLLSSFSIDSLDNFLIDIASHEFFHILTPLNLHSQEIESYNFRNPTFSKHLWLYEGMTEYETLHCPMKQKTSDMTSFLSKISEKMERAKEFDANLSLTEMSTKAMERQDQYYNFYLKGTLLNLCLDIELRERSKGKMGTQELMQLLVKRYGRNKPFKDDELFDTITALTFPEIRQFFKDYVEGTKPLPLKETFTKVGFETNPKLTKIRLTKNPTEEQLLLRKWWLE